MTTTLTTLPDFIVTIDRAQHTVIERVEGVNITRTIDFGVSGPVADAVNAWLDMGAPSAMNALADAMNAYLLAEFAARA
jgi:hypothetical protein